MHVKKTVEAVPFSDHPSILHLIIVRMKLEIIFSNIQKGKAGQWKRFPPRSTLGFDPGHIQKSSMKAEAEITYPKGLETLCVEPKC